MSASGAKKGPPKHQNRSAWKPDRGVKKKDKELGGKAHPFASISGVCSRCKDQIQWRRKYGKYKPLTEPAKCHSCGKRSVRQAYHALCTACATEKKVCAKCCHPSEDIVGRDVEEEEAERKQLEQAMNTLRERDRRTLLRALEKGSTGNPKTAKIKHVTSSDNDDGGGGSSESEADDISDNELNDDEDEDDELRDKLVHS